MILKQKVILNLWLMLYMYLKLTTLWVSATPCSIHLANTLTVSLETIANRASISCHWTWGPIRWFYRHCAIVNIKWRTLDELCVTATCSMQTLMLKSENHIHTVLAMLTTLRIGITPCAVHLTGTYTSSSETVPIRARVGGSRIQRAIIRDNGHTAIVNSKHGTLDEFWLHDKSNVRININFFHKTLSYRLIC